MTTKRSFALGGLMAALLAGGCLGPEEVGEFEGVMLETASKVAKSPKLNLSHIACTDDGDVLAHFVLLFAGNGEPSDLTGTYNGGDFGPAAPTKNSGNVWHYNVIFPSGELEILSAYAVTSLGAAATLHNPSEYSGDYQCGPETPQCPIVVEPADLLCIDQPLGNPGAECGYFDLVPAGKDDGLCGLSFVATQDAYVAIVKSGSGGCEKGQAYRVYVDVSAGDILETPTYQDISHVTYCDCPTE
jgi:hypothetical protein